MSRITRSFRRILPTRAGDWLRRASVVALALQLAAGAGAAEGPDDRFIDIYNLIQRADQSPDRQSARQLYEDAQSQLRLMQRDYPSWNERVISYRLRYTADKLSALASAPAEPAPVAKAPATSPTALAPSGEVITQFNELSQQIRTLQSDKQLLEAKLREALSAQPAPVDPREFQAAIERIANLQQTNKVLVANLQQQLAERSHLVDKVVVEETQKALADANKALAAQKEKAAQMDRERAAAAAELKRLQDETVKPLKLENTTLKQQVSGLKSDTDKGRQVADLTAQLARLESGLQELKQKNATLTADKTSLEKQLEDLRAKSAEEGIVKISQLESQLAVAQSDAARQAARVEDITARLSQEKQARASLQGENQTLAQRVAELTATTASDATLMKQLRDALATEKAERTQAEAELKAAEQKLATLQASVTARPPAGTAADANAEAIGAALLRDTQVKGLQAEVQKLREAVTSSTQRETELTGALQRESALRQRLEREKSDIEKRLAAASVELAANRVEKSRAPLPTTPGAAGPRGAELEMQVRQLEQEREELRRQLSTLVQRSPLALATARIRRAVSPRDRPTEFLQYRQLKAFAPESLIQATQPPAPLTPPAPRR